MMLRRVPKNDSVFMLCIGAVAAVAATYAYWSLIPDVLHYSTWDYWFEGDPPAAVSQMSERWSAHHHRTSHHPLFSLLVSMPVQTLQALPGIGTVGAVGVAIAVVAALSSGILFATFRLIGLRRLDAGVFTALAASSSSAIFWFPVPESYSFGALSIVAAIAVAALHERRFLVPNWLFGAASAATLSFTSTNWTVGLAMLSASLQRRKAVIIAVASALVVAGLWVAQKVVYPLSDNPLNLTTDAESIYLFNEEALGLWAKARAFFIHSVVMPEVGSAYGFRLSVQGASIAGSGALHAAATALWIALLTAGGWAAMRLRSSSTMRVLLLSLLGQLVLHLVFGIETFLYSAHFGPLLVTTCAFAAVTPLRRFVMPVAGTLAILCAVNNLERFGAAADGLRARFERERAFTAALKELTLPGMPIICGREALAGRGEGKVERGPIAVEPRVEIILEGDPDTCAFLFSEVELQRSGWILVHEDWSIDAVETLRKRGARYFVTPYEYGMNSLPTFAAEMDRRYQRLDTHSGLTFYDLAE